MDRNSLKLLLYLLRNLLPNARPSSMASEIGYSRSFVYNGDFLFVSMSPSISTSGASPGHRYGPRHHDATRFGTNRTFCFAMLCIVDPRTRFTLAVLPIATNGFRIKVKLFAHSRKRHASMSRFGTSTSTMASTGCTSRS